MPALLSVTVKLLLLVLLRQVLDAADVLLAAAAPARACTQYNHHCHLHIITPGELV